MPTGTELRTRLMNQSDVLAALARRQAPLIANPTAFPIKEGFTITLAAGAAFTQVVSFRLPSQMIGVLTSFVYGCSTVDDFDFVRWQLRINGQPQVGYDNMVGPMATFVFPEPLQLNLPQDSTVAIFAAELSGLVSRRNIAAGLMGTYWPMGNTSQSLAPTGGVR